MPKNKQSQKNKVFHLDIELSALVFTVPNAAAVYIAPHHPCSPMFALIPSRNRHLEYCEKVAAMSVSPPFPVSVYYGQA